MQAGPLENDMPDLMKGFLIGPHGGADTFAGRTHLTLSRGLA